MPSFETAGLSDEGVRKLMSAHRETKRRVQLLSDVIAVFEEFNREQGQVAGLDETGVYFLLLGRYGGERQVNREDVAEALALLGSRLIGALQRTPEGYVLTQSPESVRRRFTQIAVGLARTTSFST